MKTFKFLFLIFIGLSFIGCRKNGTKALDKGRYYEAVLQAVEKLKKDTDNSKSADVLSEAYEMAVIDLTDDINKAKSANQQFRYERVLDAYSKLNKMHDLISRCVSCRRLVSPNSYFKEAEEARDLASNERYIYASNQLSLGTIEGGREAYESYLKLFDYAPNFKDVRTKLDEALDAGSYHVVVEPPQVNSILYSLSNEYFQDRINEFLRDNKRINKFIRFYSPEEAKAIKLQPDHLVKLQFVDFTVGETIIEKNNQTLKADSVKTGTAKIDGKNVDVYGSVTAQFTNNKKTVRSAGLLQMEIQDFQNSRVLQKETIPGEFIWVNEWASYNGDERALNADQLNMTKRREELPPAPQQLFVEFCRPIYDQLVSKVRRFYDKY